MAAKKKGRAPPRVRKVGEAEIHDHLLILDRLGLLESFQKTCEHHQVLPEWVLKGARNPKTVDARHAFIIMLRERGMSYSEVARVMNMDPTSVIAAVRRWKKRHAEPTNAA